MTIFAILLSLLLFVQEGVASEDASTSSGSSKRSISDGLKKFLTIKKTPKITRQPETFLCAGHDASIKPLPFHVMLPEHIQKNFDLIWGSVEIQGAGSDADNMILLTDFKGFKNTPYNERMGFASIHYSLSISEIFANDGNTLTSVEEHLYLGLILAKLGDPGCFVHLRHAKGNPAYKSVKGWDQWDAFQIFANISTAWYLFLKDQPEEMQKAIFVGRNCSFEEITSCSSEYINRFFGGVLPAEDESGDEKRLKFTPYYFDQDIRQALEDRKKGLTHYTWLEKYINFAKKLSETDLSSLKTLVNEAEKNLKAAQKNTKKTEADEKKAQQALDAAKQALDKSILSFESRMWKGHYPLIKSLKQSVEGQMTIMKNKTLSAEEESTFKSLGLYFSKLNALIKALPDFQKYSVARKSLAQSKSSNRFSLSLPRPHGFGSGFFGGNKSPRFEAVEQGQKTKRTPAKSSKKKKKSPKKPKKTKKRRK